MTHNNDCWDFQLPIAALRSGKLAARVDVSRPQLGVHDLCFGKTKIAGAIMACEWIPAHGAPNPAGTAAPSGWPMELADAYVRGGDLVANYDSVPNSYYAPEIYWRAGSTEHGARSSGREYEAQFGELSLQVSIRTQLLDSQPRIDVGTHLAADEVMRIATDSSACLLWRLADVELSYAEVLLGESAAAPFVFDSEDGMMRASWQLFDEYLEKGVIRRAELLGMLLPREGDAELAAEFCLAAKGRPLPLTT